jgi:hypothetical protein
MQKESSHAQSKKLSDPPKQKFTTVAIKAG